MIELIDKSREILKQEKNKNFKKTVLDYFSEYEKWLEELNNIN